MSGVPVLAYHGFTRLQDDSISASEKPYWLGSDQFRSHLEYIHKEGYRVGLLEELWDDDKPVSISESLAVLTFDDGLASDYEIAFPLLTALEARGTFFLNTSTVGRPRYLGWQQIREMQKAGLSFQSHSHDHVDLTRLGTAVLERQLRASKESLEDRLGSPVRFLSVPYGLMNRKVVDTARQVGYRAVCGTRCWPARPGADVISRVVLRREYTLDDLSQYLEGRGFKYLGRLARRPLSLPRWMLLRFRPARVGVALLEGKQ